MKLRNLMLIGSFLFLLTSVNGQDSGFSPKIKMGLMAGYNNANATDILSNNLNFNSVNGFHIGGSLELHLVKKFSLETALLINQKGFEVMDNTMIQNAYKIDYLSFQLLGKIYLTKNIRLLIGSEASVLLTSTASNLNFIDPSTYETSDYSYLLGLEFGILDKFAINAKINNSFSSVIEFTQTDQLGNPIGNAAIKNRVFSVGATFYPFRFEMF